MKRALHVALALALCGAASASTGVAAASAPPDRNQPLRLRRSVMPLFPNTLLAQGITDGWARVVIDVDTTGLPSDWLLVGYTYKEFGDAAVTAIREWQFHPLVIEGESVASQVAVAFNFEAKGVVLDITPATDVMRIWFRGLQGKGYRPCTLAEIDAIPVPEIWVEPLYPRDLEDRGVTGSATVEFYIDESGAVRMPAVFDADFPELGILLADAVKQWKFAPPTRKGQPVLVHARQTVTFGKDHDE